MTKDERIFYAMIDLARANPGQAVSLVSVGREIRIGLLNIVPEADDWFYEPINLATGESIGVTAKKQKSRQKREKKGEPGGTRTLNQLIKSLP